MFSGIAWKKMVECMQVTVMQYMQMRVTTYVHPDLDIYAKLRDALMLYAPLNMQRVLLFSIYLCT